MGGERALGECLWGEGGGKYFFRARNSHQVLRVRPPGIEWKTGRNQKLGQNWPRNRKWLSARNGGKMAQKWRKNGIWGHFSIFSPFLGHFFPFWAGSHFLFFGQFLPIFAFRPVFHSIPGGLTRKPSIGLGESHPYSRGEFHESGKKKQHKHKLFGPDFPRTFLTLTPGCPGIKKFLPTTAAAGKCTFWRGRP